MFATLRAKARESDLIRNTYGRARWYSSSQGLAEIKRIVTHLGWSVQCPCCGWRGRMFYSHSEPNPRPNAICPHCKSKERHRLLCLYLLRQGLLLSESTKVLEIAPGPYSYFLFRGKVKANYVTLDRESSLAITKGDVCNLPFSNGSFGLIVCYHVLEHVLDDSAAIRELGRVLDTQGQLLIQVPIEGEITREDQLAVDPRDRLRLFGQEDHVRSYGHDFPDRLRAEGLEVEEVDFSVAVSAEDIRRYGFRRGEFTYICSHKPGK